MLIALWSIVAPVLICALIGYCWGRSPIPYETEFVSRAVINIGVPCLIISAFNSANINLDDFLQIARLTLVIMLGCALLGFTVIRITGGDIYSLLAPVVISNSGNMGIPLSLFAFGQQGLALAVSYFMVMTSTHMTLGVALQSRAAHGITSHIKELARLPLIYAIAISLLLLITGQHLPAWLANTVDLLGDFSIPLMLITLGVSLSRLKAGTWRISLGYSILRIGGGLSVGLLAVWLLAAEGNVRNVALLQSMMPAAVFNYLIALKYDRQPETVAGTVMISTLIAFFTVPLLLAYL